MKIARVSHGDRPQLGIVDEARARVGLVGGALGRSDNPVLTVIERGMSESEVVRAVDAWVLVSAARFLPPFSKLTRNVFAIGKNYADHATEFDRSGFNATQGDAGQGRYPQIFTKATTSLVGPGDAIQFDPRVSTAIDYEGEIAVVVGRECRNVHRDDAMNAVWGYVLLNDVTARDLQRSHAQWFFGKSLDTFCPMGPWISTADEIEPAATRLRTWVNGELRQDAALAA